MTYCSKQRMGRHRHRMHMRAGRHPGQHGRHGRRLLKHGDMRYLLLQMISAEPRHGYDLMKAVSEKTGGAYEPSPGVIYPALEVMQDLGWIRAEAAEDGKKVFHTTPDGEAALEAAQQTIEEIETRIGEVAAGGRADVRRSMRRLRHAIMEKLEAEGGRSEKAEAIAGILEEALGRIEAA